MKKGGSNSLRNFISVSCSLGLEKLLIGSNDDTCIEDEVGDKSVVVADLCPEYTRTGRKGLSMLFCAELLGREEGIGIFAEGKRGDACVLIASDAGTSGSIHAERIVGDTFACNS